MLLSQCYCRNVSSDRVSELRELTDPRSMRAMTHPVRLALLEALHLEGPLTATQAGELIGEPPNTCSFHFRQLAKYGFVEEAGPASGRSRPWRLISHGIRYSDVHEDPDTAITARNLDRMLRSQYLTRMEAFYASRSDYPVAWQETTGGSQWLLRLTPDELRALDEEIQAVLRRYREGSLDRSTRPPESLPVEILLFAYPVRPPVK
jgi:DNA-binding transcriptional ArsR family regulator